MKKAPIIIICVVVLLGAVGWGAYKWLSKQENAQVNNEESSEENEAEREELAEQREEIQGVITEENLTEFNEKGLNPFGQEKQKNELTDNTYQEYIHGMSHQKVKANKKWGFYEIHPQRIEWLLDGLDEVDVKHENVYRDILGKWNAGDFATADHDHNAIWELQEGTVGRATGILSAGEEQEYVNSNSD
ncbi:hypothetical protein CIL05_09970 [Virgibacillus profundi]|uniref:CTP synthase n=1 Tax=Virgibacillus profundi TaxID=2024555 RepID=A0A2A2IEW6_9BACI|nr:DUF6241 domain-containing protein [Virgibacillus profundi]PAV29690.1 hypothetical protein CIL05_09970 [Virgibacillus profundi]PXY53862.1 hypothetical protein CIT14_10065 [Virgibacillus profundi]